LDHAQVNEFAAELLTKPKRVAIEAGHTEHADITKRFYLADNLSQKEILLQHFLASERSQQVIVFTATRSDTDRLAKLLNEQSLNAVALSGELNQGQRNQIMDSFAKGQHKILVTTDLASRGLDLINVSHVINFDMPKHTEEFVHRIGRTGRAGTQGDAISLIGPNDWLSFKNVEAFLQQKIAFNKVDSIKVKFKGLKPKKVKLTNKPAKQLQDTKPVIAKPRKVIKKTFVDIQDVGAMKIIKRKKPLTPEQIEDSNTKEQE
jgi:superfamily II DNA/RNA helicase